MDNMFYRIGPHFLKLINRTSMDVRKLLPSFEPFLLDNDVASREKLLFICTLVDRLDEPKEPHELVRFEWQDASVVISSFSEGHVVHIYPFCGDGIKKMLLSLTDRTVIIELSAQEKKEVNAFLLNNFLMMAYAFIGAGEGTLQIHASVIDYQGKGYLFLGKSGTGKSTHSSLWLQHIPGSELLNDDNPIVHYCPVDGSVTVYGSPWSGKTPCYLQKQFPVGAIVRLKQSPENNIVRERMGRAFAALLPACSCLNQDDQIYNGVLDAVTQIATVIPIYKLECLPNQEAAELCCKTIGCEQ